MDKWSKNYISCLNCSKTEKRHKAKGLCLICYEKQRDSKTISKRESQKKYRDNNREKVRECQRLEKQRKKIEIHSLLGSICIKCGFTDIRALQIDHINGGGHIERKEYPTNPKKYYSNILTSIKNKEGKYQLLCANCNWIKRFENNEVRKPNYEKI
jgi:hypothetical protein